MTSVPAPEPEASGADASALPPPEEVQVSAARPRLYALVDSARDGTVTVLVKRARGRVFRAALISLELLDPSARARLPTWPSWVRTEARGKLGDLISAAAGDGHSPGVPQVLLDRADTAPLAVLVDAALVSPGNAPVVVPAGADNGDAPSVQLGDTARDGGQLPEPVGAPDARPSGNPTHSVASVADAESTPNERPSDHTQQNLLLPPQPAQALGRSRRSEGCWSRLWHQAGTKPRRRHSSSGSQRWTLLSVGYCRAS
ncbi:DnaB-like helicase C-terminal domain protein (plasmid) [Streptomyces alboflavus]|uniref:DnaB-like helicase C-terminal domain protein n=1 Tax=Streptomyces alboflavus TaxID=67267 RepID=A0A291W5G3_9ACTN|nr:hypothetical protein [Streptomyces alboflavus]ATM24782.1 DnaB-like helicase C-terminal domain protein [Streptomyces alboflavus]